MQHHSGAVRAGAISRRVFMGGVAGSAATAVAPFVGTASANGVAKLKTELGSYVRSGETPGLVALVGQGEDVDVHAAGVRTLETGSPMQRDTIFAVASIGKVLIATAALILLEDGVVGLDDPVDRWLPELTDRRVIRSLESDLDDTVPAKRAITLRDLLTLRMGLGAIFADPADSPLLQRMGELEVAPGPKLFGHSADEYMRRLASLPLAHHPGERWLYHTGFDVAGVLIERASGMSLSEFQRERIFEPMGMTGTGFWVPAEEAHRLASIYQRDPDTGAFEPWNPASGDSFAEPPPFEAGGGGHVSTVDDFYTFGRMLINKGVHNGQRILSEAGVIAMLTDQITPEQKAASPFLPGFWETHGWGLGLAVVTAPDEISSTPGRFGWWGGFGTTFFVDPHSETVALLFMPRMMAGADDTEISDAFLRMAFQ